MTARNQITHDQQQDKEPLFDIRNGLLIQAQPGFYVLQEIWALNDLPAMPDKQSVIAWWFDNDSLVAVPVTIDGGQREYAAMLHPNGEVYGYCGDGWEPTLEDWVGAAQAEHAFKKGISAGRLKEMREELRDEMEAQEAEREANRMRRPEAKQGRYEASTMGNGVDVHAAIGARPMSRVSAS
jgi:hypothetical protein